MKNHTHGYSDEMRRLRREGNTASEDEEKKLLMDLYVHNNNNHNFSRLNNNNDRCRLCHTIRVDYIGGLRHHRKYERIKAMKRMNEEKYILALHRAPSFLIFFN